MANTCVILVVAVLLTCLLVAGAGAADLLAGAARVDITPKMPVYLAGYGSNRLSDSVKTPLSARALVIKSGDKVVTIVGVDSMGVPGVLQQEIRGMVKSVPQDTVMIAATHSHSAPDLYGMWGAPGTSGVNPEYLKAFKEGLLAAIEQAAAAVQPAKLKLGAIQTQGIIMNHRKVPILDPELSAMQLVDAQGKTIATLANLPCHAEIMHTKAVSADFPYYFYQKVEKDLGGVALFINGAEGGMITADIPGGVYSLEGKPEADDWCRKIGEAVAEATEKALAEAKPIENPELSYKITDISVPLENPAYQQAMKEGLMPSILVDGKINTKVAALALGPAQIATIPGELLPNEGLHLKRKMTGSPKFLFGLTFDELGYIVSADDWGLDLYHYEAQEASIGPEIGPTVMNALLSLLSEVKPTGVPAAAAAPGAGGALAGQVAAWFQALPGKLDKAKAEGVTSVYHFTLTGDGGGEWTISIADQKATVENKAPEKADLNVKISAQDWMDIVTGKLDAMAAFTAGRLEVDDVGRALEMAGLFLSD